MALIVLCQTLLINSSCQTQPAAWWRGAHPGRCPAWRGRAAGRTWLCPTAPCPRCTPPSSSHGRRCCPPLGLSPHAPAVKGHSVLTPGTEVQSKVLTQWIPPRTHANRFACIFMEYLVGCCQFLGRSGCRCEAEVPRRRNPRRQPRLLLVDAGLSCLKALDREAGLLPDIPQLTDRPCHQGSCCILSGHNMGSRYSHAKCLGMK